MSELLERRKQEIETNVALLEKNIRNFQDQLANLNREYIFILGKLEGLKEKENIFNGESKTE